MFSYSKLIFWFVVKKSYVAKLLIIVLLAKVNKKCFQIYGKISSLFHDL